MKSRPHIYGDAKRTAVETPDNILDAVRAEFGTPLFDPCPYTPEGRAPAVDGLAIEWGRVNFVNPPFKKIEPWLHKAIAESRKGNKVSVLLIPVRTSTNYWQLISQFADQVRWIVGKIIFKGYERAAPMPLALVVFRSNYRIWGGQRPAPSSSLFCEIAPAELLRQPALISGFPCLSLLLGDLLLHPEASRYRSYEKFWLAQEFSLLELLEQQRRSSGSSVLERAVLPLLYQLLRCTPLGLSLSAAEQLLSSPTQFHERMPLPRLLVLFAPLLFATPQRTAELLRHSVLQGERLDIATLMSLEWFESAAGFLRVYLTEARRQRAIRTRQNYLIPCAGFSQDVIFM